jgi:hypothetical protein
VLRILLEFEVIVLVVVVMWRSSVHVVVILEGLFAFGWKVVARG